MIKIYTKTGDKGTTGLIGGTRVAKHHLRIEAYGTIDELNSWVGLLRDQKISASDKKILVSIQDRLFTIGSALASDPEKSKMKIPEIKDPDVTLLEKEIDKINNAVPEMRSFILPGGHPFVSYCHITRCICRRAERRVTALSDKSFVNPIIIIYLNRLSDYLFMFSRKFSHSHNIPEIPWTPIM